MKITKQQFITCIDAIRDQYVITEAYNERMQTLLPNTVDIEVNNGRINNAMIGLLQELTGDVYPSVIECHFGWEVKNRAKNFDVSTAEKVYDFLKFEQNKPMFCPLLVAPKIVNLSDDKKLKRFIKKRN